MDTKVSEEIPQTSDDPKESTDEKLQEPEVEVEEKPKEPEVEKTASVTSQTEPESQECEPQKEQVQSQTIPLSPPVSQLEHKLRIIVKHSILGNKIPSQ